MFQSASLVKLVPANNRKLYINLEDVNGGLGQVTQSGFGVYLPLRKELVHITRSKKSAAGADDLVLGAGDSALVSLGTIKPSKYQVSLAINPELICSSQSVIRITAPTIIEPKQELALRILVEVVSGTVDLAEFSHDLAVLYVHA